MELVRIIHFTEAKVGGIKRGRKPKKAGYHNSKGSLTGKIKGIRTAKYECLFYKNN